MDNAENHDRKEWLVEELWQLIQDSKWLVAEIKSLSDEYDVVRRIAADDKGRRKVAGLG